MENPSFSVRLPEKEIECESIAEVQQILNLATDKFEMEPEDIEVDIYEGPGVMAETITADELFERWRMDGKIL